MLDKNYAKKLYESRVLVESHFPSHVACEYRKLLSSTSEEELLLAGVTVFQRLVEHCSYASLALYIHVCSTLENFPRAEKTDFLIWSTFDRIGLGNVLRILRELSAHLEEHEALSLLSGLRDFSSAAGCFDKMIALRNKAAHDAIPTECTDEMITNLLGCIDYCSFWNDLWFFVPILQESISSYAGYAFVGSGGTPLYVTVEANNIKYEFFKTYLVSSDSSISIPLDPFWKYTHEDSEGSNGHHLCFVSIKRNKAVLIDPTSGYRASEKAIFDEYQAKVQILSPDYVYQKKPYLAGHRLWSKKRITRLKLNSYDGDLETFVEIRVKKIKYDNVVEEELIKSSTDEVTTELDMSNGICQSEKNEILLFDYHDAPLYPISDNVFDLKITDDDGEELNVVFEIENEAFRKFSAILPKMQFDEERVVNLSCFEPMLFSGIKNEGEDYYETEIDSPVDEFEFYLQLIPGLKFTGFRVEYLDGSELILKDKSTKVTKEADGSEVLYFKVEKPIVGKQVIVRFNVDSIYVVNEESSDYKDCFRAGLAVHQILSEKPYCKWRVDYKKDGSIIVEPE
jgi:hypothetical protein